MPKFLRIKIPKKDKNKICWPEKSHSKTVIFLSGCVQSSIAPNINAAAANIVDKLGFTAIMGKKASCCGAVTHHLNDQDLAMNQIRTNIDAWWPLISNGAEAIVMTASGCGVMVKDYGYLLKDDSEYSQKAKRISEITLDLSEFVLKNAKKLRNQAVPSAKEDEKITVAFHSPCTLQHGQQTRGVIEEILDNAGFSLTSPPEQHLCCGSAGTYSILQPKLSAQLLKNKISALMSGSPDIILTANIGCLTHLQSGTSLKVKHWAEIINEKLTNFEE